MQWADYRGINYEHGTSGSSYMYGGVGVHISTDFSGSGGTDMAKLRAANLDADNATRALHAADQELHTDTEGLKRTPWKLGTRGKKLRNLRFGRLRTQDMLEDLEKVIEDKKRKNSDPVGESALKAMEGDVRKLNELLGYISELNAMVVKEIEEGWDWKLELDAQEVIGRKQNRLAAKLEAKYNPGRSVGRDQALYRQAMGLPA